MKLPLMPTLIVAAAVAAMVGLGFWQIERAGWKERLLAQYEEAAHLPAVALPAPSEDPQALLFRQASAGCAAVAGWREIAGRNLRDQPGWAHIASCRSAGGAMLEVDVGWSESSASPDWTGGPVRGILVPDRRHELRLVASTPAPGLEPSQPASPDTIPNNHILYAVQWFLFAVIALVIYFLALRRRQSVPGRD